VEAARGPVVVEELLGHRICVRLELLGQNPGPGGRRATLGVRPTLVAELLETPGAPFLAEAARVEAILVSSWGLSQLAGSSGCRRLYDERALELSL